MCIRDRERGEIICKTQHGLPGPKIRTWGTRNHLRWGQRLAIRSHGVRGLPGPQMRGTRGTRNCPSGCAISRRAIQHPRSPKARDRGHPQLDKIRYEIRATRRVLEISPGPRPPAHPPVSLRPARANPIGGTDLTTSTYGEGMLPKEVRSRMILSLIHI